ncbi:MAG: polyprenyl synthetase family protein [Desulfobacterales bacterium]|nr:polyprenyl synthetase family protein [Desulfobacterales bacterium]
MLAGGSPAQIEALSASTGRRVGLAFQVVDDILNVEGDPAVMGKAAGTDRLRRKNSYPGLLGLEKSKEFAQNLVQYGGRAPLPASAPKPTRCGPSPRYVVERKK